MNEKKTIQKQEQCNACGKFLKINGQRVEEGVCRVEQHWGYFSEKDTQCHRFVLCEDCYDKITAGFQIPPKISEDLELL